MNYNCNENNEQYYIGFKNALEQIFDKNSFKEIEYIPQVLELMGYEIIFNACKRTDYQGELYLIYKKTDKIYWFESAYGSCSYCDIWYEAYESIENFMEIFKKEDRSTVEFNNKQEIKEFIKNHYIYDAEVKLFIKQYIEE